jgi:hypothetical protein
MVKPAETYLARILPLPRIDVERGARMGMILLIILVLSLLGAAPAWPYSRQWGYGPSGIVGLLLVVLLVLLILRLVPWGYGPYP